MIKNIERLITDLKNNSVEVPAELISIAAKIKKETLHGKDFLALGIEEMESWIDPSKVDGEVSIGSVELEL